MKQKNYKRMKEVWKTPISDGVFTYLHALGVPWAESVAPTFLNIAYHYNRSGCKITSPLVDEYITDGEIPTASKAIIANVLYNLYAVKWEKLYRLLALEYNPISNYDMTETETETGERSGTEVHSGTDTRNNTGTQTNSGTHSETTTHTGTDSTSATDTTETSGETGVENGIAGFNSSTYQKNTNSTGTTSGEGTTTHSDTITHNTTDGTQGSDSNTRTDNLAETLIHGESVTTGDSNEVTRELTRSGNIGVTTSQQMITSEVELWEWNFFMSVFNDIDTILTLQTY